MTDGLPADTGVYCLACWNAHVHPRPHKCAGPTVTGGRTYRCPCDCQDDAEASG